MTALAVLSCGKKVQNTDPNAGKFVSRSPALSGSSLRLNSRFNSSGVVENDLYQFKAEAWITIPEYVIVESGAPENFVVRVYFNTKNEVSLAGSKELFCDYRNTKQYSSQGKMFIDNYYHQFLGCFEDIDADGVVEELNYSPGVQIAQDENHYVRLEYISGETDSETTVSVDVDLEWF